MANFDIRVREEYRKRVVEIYEEHKPGKLDSVDGLLEKYAGKEHTLYMKVCHKYHEPVMPRFKPPKIEESSSESENDEEGEESSEDKSDDEADLEEGPAPPKCFRKIMYQTLDNQTGFSEGELKNDDENLFLNVDPEYLEQFRNPEKQFHFRLRFPDFAEVRQYDVKQDEDGNNVEYIEWKQENLPTAPGGVVGYEEVCNLYGPFKGLSKAEDDDPCIMQSGDFQCAFTKFPENGLHGPTDTDWGEPFKVKAVILEVLVPPQMILPLSCNLFDHSVRRHHGELEGDAKLEHNCLQFPKDGKGYVVIKNSDDFHEAKSVSVGCWFQKPYKGTRSMNLITKGPWRKGFSLSINQQGDGDYLRGAIGSSQGVSRAQAVYKKADEFEACAEDELAKYFDEDADISWHHVAMTFGEKVQTLYHNGEVICCNKGVSGSVTRNKFDVCLGAENKERDFLCGAMFDVFMYKQCLTQGEVKQLMLNGKSRIAAIEESMREAKAAVDAEKNKAKQKKLDKLEKMKAKLARRRNRER